MPARLLADCFFFNVALSFSTICTLSSFSPTHQSIQVQRLCHILFFFKCSICFYWKGRSIKRRRDRAYSKPGARCFFWITHQSAWFQRFGPYCSSRQWAGGWMRSGAVRMWQAPIWDVGICRQSINRLSHHASPHAIFLYEFLFSNQQLFTSFKLRVTLCLWLFIHVHLSLLLISIQ